MWIKDKMQDGTAETYSNFGIEEDVVEKARKLVNRNKMKRLSVEEYLRKRRGAHE